MIDALISIDYLDGSSYEGLSTVNSSQVLVPQEERYPTSYFVLGVEHLLSGIDHILFCCWVDIFSFGLANSCKNNHSIYFSS